MTDPNLDKTLVLIPARMASTRLPGKPLADICGLPMIVQVAKRAREAAIGRIVVAVDHDDTFAAVANAGFEVVMTRKDHQSGSDRIYEALQAVDPEGRAEIVVNVQGDLPTIDPETIRASLRPLEDPAVDIATLTVEIKDEEEKTMPSVVKVVGSADFRQSRCARSTSPAPPRLTAMGRSTTTSGSTPIVAPRSRNSSALGPSPLEKRESLEQLRALEAGMRIDVEIVDIDPARCRYSRRPRKGQDVSFPPLLSDGIPPKAVP